MQMLCIYPCYLTESSSIQCISLQSSSFKTAIGNLQNKLNVFVNPATLLPAKWKPTKSNLEMLAITGT